MLRLSCALAAALATVGCATSPESSAFGPGQISEATMKEVTRTLSLDEFEGRSPGILARSGWSRTIFKPGDTITVDFSPARDGSHTGLTTRVTLADGTVLSQASPQ